MRHVALLAHVSLVCAAWRMCGVAGVPNTLTGGGCARPNVVCGRARRRRASTVCDAAGRGPRNVAVVRPCTACVSVRAHTRVGVRALTCVRRRDGVASVRALVLLCRASRHRRRRLVETHKGWCAAVARTGIHAGESASMPGCPTLVAALCVPKLLQLPRQLSRQLSTQLAVDAAGGAADDAAVDAAAAARRCS